MHILVVEDNYDVRTLLEHMLRAEGYEVTSAADGIEALQIESSQQPDVVVLDVNLPLLDGYEVCRRIKARRAVPVVILTVRAEPAEIELGMSAGADVHLTKPFDMPSFLQSIRHFVKGTGAE
jgi:CheY-like chemotaxis protein